MVSRTQSRSNHETIKPVRANTNVLFLDSCVFAFYPSGGPQGMWTTHRMCRLLFKASAAVVMVTGMEKSPYGSST